MNSPTPDVWQFMATLDRPQFRPLSLAQFDYQGRSYAVLEDPLGVFSTPVLVPLEVFLPICRHFDGQLSLEEIRRRTGLRARPESRCIPRPSSGSLPSSIKR